RARRRVTGGAAGGGHLRRWDDRQVRVPSGDEPARLGSLATARRNRRLTQSPSGSTSTTLRPLRSPNLTEPSTSEKSVSSPPWPTLRPGWNLVPRWRTRIVPAVILVPSYTFTPRR